MCTSDSSKPSRMLCISMLLLLTALALGWQIASPSDLDDNEQPITLSHFMDVALDGHWLTQINPFEGLSTKPPAYHWVGGVGVMLTGSNADWKLKLSAVLCFLVAAALVVALARTCLNWPASILAGAFWVANYHVVKLAYTARPDMMLTMFMTLAILALQYHRPMWQLAYNKPRPKSYWLWLVILWSAVALAGLTKGPPGLLVAALVAIMLWRDRRLFSRDTWPHAVGMAMAIGVTLGWLWLAIHFYPQWNDVLDKELWNRLTGDATHTKHYPPRWREIPYFLGRYAPWSVLAVAAMVILPWWRRKGRRIASDASEYTQATPVAIAIKTLPVPSWSALWIIVVLGILALPKGRRADHILPVYAGASVLVAALVVWAQSGHKASRLVVHILIGGVVLAGLAAAIATPWLPKPDPLVWPVAMVTPAHVATYSVFILITAAITGIVASLTGLWALHTRRYYHASFAACFCVVAMLGIFQTTYNRAAQNRNGDYVVAFARTATIVSRKENRSPLFYDTGYVPVQSLMGFHEQMMNYEPVPSDKATLLITTTRGWQTLLEAGAIGQVILQTPRLEESSGELVIVRPEWLPEALP